MDANKKTILVPVDLTRESNQFHVTAFELAYSLGAQVALMHVVTEDPDKSYVLGPGERFPNTLDVEGPIPQPEPEGRRLNRDLLQESHTLLERFAVPSEGVPFSTIVSVGDPAQEILREIEKSRPYLVVMLTHHRGRLARAFLGSVTDNVVRSSPVPVVVIPAID